MSSKNFFLKRLLISMTMCIGTCVQYGVPNACDSAEYYAVECVCARACLCVCVCVCVCVYGRMPKFTKVHPKIPIFSLLRVSC